MNRQDFAHGLAIAVLGLMATGPLSGTAQAAVGRTESTYGVTPNGGVSFTIPIRVTEGIGGLTPNLAISYVGPGTRTILGVGTALSGISYITPCRKTIAQDLNAAPVTLTSADRYCLDGARLRLASGTYGASGSIYRTELDQMVRVTSLNSVNGIPGYFKVEMPNGVEYEYGNTADSKLLASGTSGAPPQFWAVNRISDPVGNSMSFVYDTNNSLRRFRPSYIDYTSSSAGAARYRVTFVYQTAIMTTLHFTPSLLGGAAKSDDKVLDQVELSHDGTVYRRIELDYETAANGNKRLQAVQECVSPFSPDDCLPATTLGWQSATTGHVTSPTTSNAVASGVMPLDINNDGFEDLVWAASGTWRYMLGSAAGYGSVINTGITATNSSKAMPLEWNGDGFWDLLIDWSDGKWRVLRGASTGFNTTLVHAGPGSGISSNTTGKSVTIADVNADGRDDLISMYLNAAVQILARFNSATGFGAESMLYSDEFVHTKNTGFIKMSGASAIRRPDFNGDNRSDLLIYGCIWETEPPGWCITNRWFQLLSNGTSFVNEGPVTSAAFSIAVRYGDFNGDGLTDIVYPASTGKWNLGFGQGSGGLSIVAGPSSTGYATYQTLTGDYDGDGYDDFYATSSSPLQWNVFLSTGTALASTAISDGISGSGTGWMLTDQNGDNLPDLGRYDSGTLIWGSYAHQGLPGDRLISSVDGLGNAVTFGYLPMSNPTVYERGTGAVYPSREFQSSTPLVRTMQVAPAGGQSFTLTYKYKQARVHAQGRAFLGMGTREISDSRNTIFITETYRQDFPYIGAPATVTVKQSSAQGANPIQSVTHSYSYHVLNATSGNERYLPYRSQTVTNAYEVGGLKDGAQITEITESHTVNTNGNSTFVAASVKDKDVQSPETGSIYRTEITSTFSEDTTAWCIALPLTRSEKRILPDGTNQTRAMTWQVEPAQCRVTQETIEPGGGSAVSLVTDLTYDSCGNVNSISSHPAGQSGLARTTSIDYGTRCQRPELITNPLDQPSTITYDWPLALPNSHTDPNGIPVGLSYDGFGRLAQRDNPDGTDVTFTLTACTAGNGWCGKNSGARLKISQATRDTSNATIRTDEQFLDGFGRLRWSHSDSLESGPSIVQTDYDAFGRPSAGSQPHFLGGTIYATTFTRDLIGRVTQINAPISEGNPSGRTTSFSYEGRDLKVTNPKTNVTTRRSNVIGHLKAVIDPSPGGTTNYSYHPFGELASIEDAADNITSWTYNVRGFATGTTDPDSGSWTYESNAFGETERIRDAKTASPAWTTEFTFDELSRPKTRLDAEGTTTWNWGTSAVAKNIGQLASITSPGSYAEVYSFDSLGRLAQQSVTADGTTYNINLTYAATTGLLGTLEYPVSTSGYRLKLGYDYANGLLKRVKHISGAPVYWEAVSTDAWGHIQDESFGNGVDTFTDFDQASGLMKAREGGLGGGTGLIHSIVDWDLNGNLKQRQDLKLSSAVTEDFFYDSLDRFDYSQRNGATNADVTLNAIGNITWKMGVGSYTYHATQKRAVTAAGSFSFGYDANGNMTSRNGSSISYTSYNLPAVINAGTGTSSTLSYGAFRNRYQQIAVTPSGTETTIYVAGLLEKVTRGSLIEYRHAIHGGKGAAAIYTRRASSQSNADTVYLHRDHLGSPELITDSAGLEIVRPSFGAYGERRDGTDWSGPPSAADLTDIANTSRRGFTGHEHLDSVGLIHMNGRVYEPVAGRFLGVDPILALGLSQDVNSYSYAWNNPLSVTDPSGLVENRDMTVHQCISCDWRSITDAWEILEFMNSNGFLNYREPMIEETRKWVFSKPGDVVDAFPSDAKWDGGGAVVAWNLSMRGVGLALHVLELEDFTPGPVPLLPEQDAFDHILEGAIPLSVAIADLIRHMALLDAYVRLNVLNVVKSQIESEIGAAQDSVAIHDLEKRLLTIVDAINQTKITNPNVEDELAAAREFDDRQLTRPPVFQTIYRHQGNDGNDFHSVIYSCNEPARCSQSNLQ
jgi:RHS repeat-associated protein